MADKKNVQLLDEEMFNATGGLNSGNQETKDFDAVGTVIMHLSGRQYQVRFDDGAELIATSYSDESVAEGTNVGLFAIAGGWTMHVLQ